MGAYSDEQGKRFHQNILDFERKHDGGLAYIWGLLRESDLQYTHKSRKPNHFWTIM